MSRNRAILLLLLLLLALAVTGCTPSTAAEAAQYQNTWIGIRSRADVTQQQILVDMTSWESGAFVKPEEISTKTSYLAALKGELDTLNKSTIRPVREQVGEDLDNSLALRLRGYLTLEAAVAAGNRELSQVKNMFAQSDSAQQKAEAKLKELSKK